MATALDDPPGARRGLAGLHVLHDPDPEGLYTETQAGVALGRDAAAPRVQLPGHPLAPQPALEVDAALSGAKAENSGVPRDLALEMGEYFRAAGAGKRRSAQPLGYELPIRGELLDAGGARGQIATRLVLPLDRRSRCGRPLSRYSTGAGSHNGAMGCRPQRNPPPPRNRADPQAGVMQPVAGLPRCASY